LVFGNTLIEEHISGIPGDDFITYHLDKCTLKDKREIAKEFVKFNERCFVGLLGDMRSYNYAMVLTNDFDRIQYRMRTIDFYQQSYEGIIKVYRPQFLKENNVFVTLVAEVLEQLFIEQYKREERSLLAKRAKSAAGRLKRLMNCMKNDEVSQSAKILELKTAFLELTREVKFKKSKKQG
jgi:hypothetical protein